MGRVAIAFLVIAVIIELFTFKVIEANLFEEVTKHIVVWLAIFIGVELFSAWIFGPLHYHFGYERRKK